MTPPVAAQSTRRAASGSRGSVRHPRRISGPGRVAQSAAVAVPAPGIALPRRRPPRPTVQPRRHPGRRATRRSVQSAPGIALRAADALEGISGSALFDRLIRGRAWIGILAFALIGMVAMQLLVLRLNTGVGRTLTRVAQLQRENAQLDIENSTYSAEDRVAPLAAASGMKLAPAGTVHFVAASPADVSRAAASLSAPIQASVSGQSRSTEAASGESGPTEAGSAAAGSVASTSEVAAGSASQSSGTIATSETANSTAEGSGSAPGSGG
jgi:hypothetical protein